jgi:hypothetical protein
VSGREGGRGVRGNAYLLSQILSICASRLSACRETMVRRKSAAKVASAREVTCPRLSSLEARHDFPGSRHQVVSRA